MISIEQNAERQLERLAAQRQLYSVSKRILAWEIVLSGPVAVLLAGLAALVPGLSSVAAVWGASVTALGILILTPWQRRLRASAAVIQEAFDCDVLILPWNRLKAGPPPRAELVKRYSDKYELVAAKYSPLRNWYSVAVDSLPIHVGRIACQRSNCWWDASQRRTYAAWVVGLLLLASVVMFGIGLRTGLTVNNFLVGVVLPLSPALTVGIRQYREQRESANRLDELTAHADELWSAALAGDSERALTARSRNLQDEILENRRRTPPVFDFVFERLRPGLETQMNYGVDELVREASRQRA